MEVAGDFFKNNIDFIVELPPPMSVGGSARQVMQLTCSVDYALYKVD